MREYTAGLERRAPLNAFCLDPDAVAVKLKTDVKNGLSSTEAAKRLEVFGPNALPEEKRRGHLAMVLDQFKDFLIIILICAAVISGMLGEYVDASAIVVIVVLNAIIGFIQEYKAERRWRP